MEKKEFIKLWLSYTTYFEAYSAAEVGRLVLAMIAYKSSGVEPEFSGSERFIWPAIKRDIDAQNEAYEAEIERNRENGKKGGRPKKEEPKKPGRFSENPKNPVGFSETHEKPRTRNKVKDKDKVKYQESVVDAHAHDEGLSRVMTAYMDKINPTPSENSLGKLKHYCEQMGVECCLRAIDIALDEKVPKWSYIESILSKRLSKGVRCIADWDAEDERWKQDGKNPGHSGKHDTPPNDGGGNENRWNLRSGFDEQC